MTQSSAEKPAKKSRWRRFLKWSARALVVLVVVSIALYAAISYWTARAIRNEIARIRAAGEPVTFADLDAMTPQADPAQDAGPLYQAAAILAAARFITPEFNNTIWSEFFTQDAGEKIPAEKTLALAQALLNRNRTVLDLLDQAALLPECSAAIEIEDGEFVVQRNLGRFRGLAYTPSLRTRVLAFGRQGESAIQSVLAEIPFTRVFDRQPTFLDALVQDTVLFQILKDTQLVIEFGQPPASALDSLGGGLAKIKPIEPRRMFIAERALDMEIMRPMLRGAGNASGDAMEPPPLPEKHYYPSGGIFAHFAAAATLELDARFIAAARPGWPQTLDALNTIADRPGSRWTFKGIFGSELAPSVARSTLTMSQLAAQLTATRAAVEIERYRLAHAGALPDSLSDVPDAASLAADPLTSKPLIYIKTADGYCIYSAGYRPPADRDKNPIAWSKKWGIHIRTHLPQ